MKKFLSVLNENHWYLIAGLLCALLIGWFYGCESQVQSLTDKSRLVTRAELQLELEYITGQAKIRFSQLDKKDELKQQLLDYAAIFGTQGQFNPTGLLNALVTIASISWGLDRNRKLKSLEAKKSG